MRYFFYVIAFCLSLYFLIHPQKSSATALPSDAIEKVNHLIEEFNYHDISSAHLRSAWAVASMLQDRPKAKQVEVFHIKNFEGDFYRVPSVEGVLYCPSLSTKYALGRGAHKHVYRALLFTPQGAEVVAACRGDDSIIHEAKILRLLSLHSPDTPFRCFFALPKDRYMLVLRYYNMGGLGANRKRGVRFSQDQKLHIARDIVASLKNMHKKGVVHRDLHDGNILLHRTKDGCIHAGLVDFGRAGPLYSKWKGRPQGARSRTPPEVLIKSYSSIDNKKADLYALGCCLFKLFFEEDFSPGAIYDVHEIVHMDQRGKLELYNKVQQEYGALSDKLHAKWNCMKEAHTLSSAQEGFYFTILALLHPDPSKRPDCFEVSSHIKNLLDQPDSRS